MVIDYNWQIQSASHSVIFDWVDFTWFVAWSEEL